MNSAREGAGTGQLIFVTGLSGSGKSTVAKCLEDLGFYTVDNLPFDLLESFVADPFRHAGEAEGVAIVTDMRAEGFARRFPRLVESETVQRLDPVVLFLEADDETLVRRFSETRRSHPIAGAESVIASIRTEREMLAEVRGIADRVYDSSEWNLHELRHQVRLEFGPREAGEAGPVVTLMSFGYKYGIPYASDLLFDVRFLPNPYFEEGLRELTGRDEPVRKFLEAQPEYEELVERLDGFLSYLLPKYAGEQRSYVSVAVGCTGGRHRSVAIVEALEGRLDAAGWTLRVSHRDAER